MNEQTLTHTAKRYKKEQPLKKQVENEAPLEILQEQSIMPDNYKINSPAPQLNTQERIL